MDKGGSHPLNTVVSSGEPFPGSRASVSHLSRRILEVASPLRQPSPTGGSAAMNERAQAGPQGAPRGTLPGAWTNVYCATCLRTRRFMDHPTCLVCETCSRRLEKVSPPFRTAG